MRKLPGFRCESAEPIRAVGAPATECPDRSRGVLGSRGLARVLRATFCRPEAYGLFLLAGILVWQLLIPPSIGLANNGDFERLMTTVGLRYPFTSYTRRYFLNTNMTFAIVDRDYDSAEMPSSALIVLELARLLNSLCTSDTLFDLRSLGAVYIILYVTAIGLCLYALSDQPLLVRLAVMLASIAVYTDAAYVSYMNSLYAEPVSLLFLLFAVAAALTMICRRQVSVATILFYFVAVTLFASSKTQNWPAGVVLVVFGLRFATLTGKRALKWATYTCVAAAALVSVAYCRSTPKWALRNTLYNSIFYGILVDSPTPESDLAELGIDPGMAQYAGAPIFSSTASAEEVDAVAERSRLSVVVFYLENPSRLVARVTQACNRSAAFRPDYLGMFERQPWGAASVGQVDDQEGGDWLSPFRGGSQIMDVVSQWVQVDAQKAPTKALTIWSDRHAVWMPSSFQTFAGTVVLFLTAMAALWRWFLPGYLRPLAELLVVLALIAAVQPFICVIGDGMQEILKHMYLYNCLFDLLVLWLIVIGAGWLSRRKPVSAPGCSEGT